MRRAIILGLVLAFAAPAQAKQHWRIVHPIVTQPACPAGVPVQTITVFNQANVRSDRLALVERAAVHQSLQLRRWWGTPCIQFGPGGWHLYLKHGAFQSTSGEHFWDGAPYIITRTGGINYEMWSSVFTHEIVETLADPANTDYSINDISYQLEIADPVELQTYRLDGVNVTDFVTPNWYAGAASGVCSTVVSWNDQWVSRIVCPGPIISPAGNAGPWDKVGVLHRAWQAMDGIDSSALSSGSR